jgi:hypothetical protein
MNARSAVGLNEMLACAQINLGAERELHHYYDFVKASIVGKTLLISSNT